MKNIDTETVEFVKLIDTTIAIIEEIKTTNLLSIKPPNEAIENLKSFRTMAIPRKLPRPSKGDVPDGTDLELTRIIGEWTEVDDLLDAAYAVEKYYKEQM
jgi:hypothetical protein